MQHDIPHPEFRTRPGRFGPLLRGEKGLELCVRAGDIPAFLLEANDLLRSGKVRQAKALLSKDRIDPLRDRAAAGPSRGDLMVIVAKLLWDTDQYDQAEGWLRMILDLECDATLHHMLGCICSKDPRRVTEGLRHHSKSSEMEPTHPAYQALTGQALIKAGRVEQGVERLRRAADLAPHDANAGCMWLWALHYVPGPGREFFWQQYCRWGRHFASQDRGAVGFPNVRDPDRRLRVGFLSPDFREHSVAKTFEPFLDGYDRDSMEVYGYGRVRHPDAFTDRLSRKFTRYQQVGGLGDEQMAERIRQDGVDILVEIGGHVEDHGLGVMALRPAPVQVDFGGIDTTGIEQMDYRITDAILDPPAMSQGYGEEQIRLPGGYPAYAPPAISPPVTALPARRSGHVTFGSFNNQAKINAYVLPLWGRVLKAVSDARLILKCPGGVDPGVRDFYASRFEEMGICRDRIEIWGMLPFDAYLQLVSRVDLALDTYPFNGCLSILEPLWMGVPTVSLAGETNVSRMGLDILSRVGLEVFVASSGSEYVAKAVAFARQIESLERIRLALRERMLQSPLCAPRRMGQEMEAAFRQMWRRWCAPPIQNHKSKINNLEKVGR